MVELGEEGDKIIALAEELATLNPTPRPMYGWKGYGGGSPSECLLDGHWKLRFTSGADATFRESPTRGKAITSQVVNATEGTFTNTIDFEKGAVTGFRVVVAGEALSDAAIVLNCRRIIFHRATRFFRRIVVPLPPFRFVRFLVRIASRTASPTNATKGGKHAAFFVSQYLDKNFRMHKTGDGNWFIQTRMGTY